MIQPPQLRIPGPTPVPDRVQRAMAAPMINHRGPEFRALLPELEAGLRWAFQTENDMLIFPASGTGGLESAVANVVSPGERVVAITASQKGWMLPPGVTMLSVSKAAWQRQASARSPRFYFDWDRAKKMQAKGMTFTTPAVSILFGLREALLMMREEGLPAIFQRHLRVAAAFRAAAGALGLRLLASSPEVASPTVTAVFFPDALIGEKSEAVFKTWRGLGLVFGGGEGKPFGQIFPIGHPGPV